MAATEGAKRKAVQDGIDRVLFKVGLCSSRSEVRGPPVDSRRRSQHAGLAAALPVLQINELEAIVGEFDGNNELLHAKL
jgi:hypothetical protein